jgi:putative inorganic carbon (hco3(-)) transporter
MSIRPEPILETEKASSPDNILMGTIRSYASIVVGFEIWILCPLIAGTMVSARLLPISVVVAFTFLLLRWLGTGALSVRTQVDLPIALLLLMLPVTWVVTVFPETTIPQVWRLLSGIALFYAIANWATSFPRLKFVTFGIIMIGMGLVLMSPISVTWVVDNKLSFLPASLYERFTVLVSDTVHPNVMGGNLVLFFPIAIGFLVFCWRGLKPTERGLLLIAALCMAVVVVLTKSRGAWMSLGITIALIALLRWRMVWLIFVLFIPVGIIAYSFYPAPNLEPYILSDALGGWDGRVEIASRAIYMVQDFPFTGIGMGSFESIADLLYPFFMFPSGEIVHAHNLFLQIAVDLGLPGFIAWLSIFLVVILCSLRIFQYGKLMNNQWFTGLGAGLLSSQMALAIHGLTDAVTWGMVRPAPFVWVIWGLAVSMANFQKKQAIVHLEK